MLSDHSTNRKTKSKNARCVYGLPDAEVNLLCIAKTFTAALSRQARRAAEAQARKGRVHAA